MSDYAIYKMVQRSWWERLFSRPWQPQVAVKRVRDTEAERRADQAAAMAQASRAMAQARRAREKASLSEFVRSGVAERERVYRRVMDHANAEQQRVIAAADWRKQTPPRPRESSVLKYDDAPATTAFIPTMWPDPAPARTSEFFSGGGGDFGGGGASSAWEAPCPSPSPAPSSSDSAPCSASDSSSSSSGD